MSTRSDRLFRSKVFVVAASAPGLMRLPLPRLAEVLEPRRTPRSQSQPSVPHIVQTVDEVMRRGRPFVRGGCTTRAVTLYYVLRRAGMDVTLVFGLGSHHGRPVGHCWIEHAGEPYLERTDPRLMFAEMATISSVGVQPVPVR